MTKRHKEEDTFTVVDKRRILTPADCEEIEIRAYNEHFPDATPAEQVAALITEVPKTYQHPRPVGENVLIKSGAAKTLYDGTSFIIPDVAQQSPNMGIVVSVGARVNPEDLKVGDLVTFSRFNTEDVDVDGETFKLCSVHDIKFVSTVHYAVAASFN